MNAKSFQPDRRGSTLLELAVAMIVGSAIFGIGVELLWIAVEGNSGAAAHFETTSSIARLAEQFRADAHAATDVIAPPAAAGQLHWIIKRPGDARIEYEVTDDGLLRTEYRANQVHARDTFRLPQNAVPHVDVQRANDAVLTSLIFRRGADPDNDVPGYILRIDAEVGRDLRIATAIEAEKAK